MRDKTGIPPITDIVRVDSTSGGKFGSLKQRTPIYDADGVYLGYIGNAAGVIYLRGVDNVSIVLSVGGTGEIWLANRSGNIQLQAAQILFQLPLNMNSEKINTLGTPTASTDAANKGYVDGKLDDITVGATARALDTIYQNTTGKLLVQTITVILGDGDNVSFQMKSTSPPDTVCARLSQGGATTIRMPFTFIIPVNWYFRFAIVAGAPTVSTYGDEQLL